MVVVITIINNIFSLYIFLLKCEVKVCWLWVPSYKNLVRQKKTTITFFFDVKKKNKKSRSS